MADSTSVLDGYALKYLAGDTLETAGIVKDKPDIRWMRLSRDSTSPLYHKYVNATDLGEYYFYKLQYMNPLNYAFLNPIPELDRRQHLKWAKEHEDDYNVHEDVFVRQPFRPEEVEHTLLTKVLDPEGSAIQNKFNFVSWVFFASFADVLLSYVGAVSHAMLYTRNVGYDPTTTDPHKRTSGFITMITGGMALRTSYASHYSADIDVKFFPKHVDADIDEETFFRDFVNWSMTQEMLTHFNRNGHHMVMVYLRTLVHSPRIQAMPIFQEFYQEFSMFYTSLNNARAQHGEDVQLQTADERGNPVTPFRVALEFPGGPRTIYKCSVQYMGRYYQLMDFSLYDKHDAMYHALVTKVRHAMSQPIHKQLSSMKTKYGKAYDIRDPHHAMIPFEIIPVVYADPSDEQAPHKVAKFYVPQEEFAHLEKRILYTDLEQGTFEFNPDAEYNDRLREFLKKKFMRSIQTFSQQETGRLPRIYVGGRKKRRHINKTRTTRTMRRTRKRTR